MEVYCFHFILAGRIPTGEATVFAYDMLTKSLYMAEMDKVTEFPSFLLIDIQSFLNAFNRLNLNEKIELQNIIIRVHNDGSQQHFLDSVAVKFMTVMSRNALIFLASNYLIVSYRLTSTFDQE